jgi:hypothetical protein
MTAPVYKTTKRSQTVSFQATPNWHEGPLARQLLFAVVVLALFLVLDGSSTPSQAWEGAPPCYLPVGMAVALLIYGGMRYLPLLRELERMGRERNLEQAAGVLAAFPEEVTSLMNVVRKQVSGKGAHAG